jgi:hypothetical protein
LIYYVYLLIVTAIPMDVAFSFLNPLKNIDKHREREHLLAGRHSVRYYLRGVRSRTEENISYQKELLPEK